MSKWQLQEAKNRLSEVVKRAQREGPQVITLRGEDTAVVISAAEYMKLTRKVRGRLSEFLRSSPLGGVEIEVQRSRDTGRDVEL